MRSKKEVMMHGFPAENCYCKK